MTGAAYLNRRCLLQRATVITNEFNEQIELWTTFAAVWCGKKDASASESYRAQEVGAEITMRVTIRYSSDVAELNPRNRLIFDGVTYNITGVRETDPQRFLEIDCVARKDIPAPEGSP